MNSVDHSTSGNLGGSGISDATFHDSKMFSDVTIKYNGRETPAHKLILAKKSMFFYKAFTGGFPVAESNVVDLGDDEDVEVIEAMIRHIYEIHYDNFELDHDGNFDFKIDVFIAADKYDVPTLRRAVVKDFTESLKTILDTGAFALIVQRLCGPTSSTIADGALQDAVVSLCAENFHDLHKHNATFAKLTAKGELLDAHFAGRVLDGIGRAKPTILPPLPHRSNPPKRSRTMYMAPW